MSWDWKGYSTCIYSSYMAFWWGPLLSLESKRPLQSNHSLSSSLAFRDGLKGCMISPSHKPGAWLCVTARSSFLPALCPRSSVYLFALLCAQFHCDCLLFPYLADHITTFLCHFSSLVTDSSCYDWICLTYFVPKLWTRAGFSKPLDRSVWF